MFVAVALVVVTIPPSLAGYSLDQKFAIANAKANCDHVLGQWQAVWPAGWLAGRQQLQLQLQLQI